LFGHEKGAFTGAVARRVGKFEEANGGTLLLDEISEMDLRLQAKLLRAIQEREIDRVGGTAPIKVDIRILATTNRDLEAEVRAGRFREDLYFRLNVVSLKLPPLRERTQDLEPLAEHFIKKYAEANGVPARPLAREALDKLRVHSWRGNVRELENAMHRAVLLAQGDTIGAEAIQLSGGAAQATAGGRPTATAAAPAGTNNLVGRTVADVERDLILDTLNHCLGNRTHAANILGISIRTLRNKLKLYSEQGAPVAPHTGGDADRPHV
jgi:DNA-binding NtrC family response regulator